MSVELNAPTTTSTATAPAPRWGAFATLLEEQRADALRQRELALAEVATSMPDPVAMRRAADLLQSIDEIDAALGRIAEGAYGTCVQCGVDLPSERLRLRPSAAGCVSCQSSVR
ncbi:TraR/DksA C4-type zinc finger protein [Blastococcus sp. URHD0036]|uniref:TraR/DksA family transcriptional regulator n=1 Tax=Blastococcus sp. URHD0036 TaxID=1380356 RepID=UPI000496ED98|nr:TraR/DksA C4-type zinc finger protein [Blastococcus sp. URHD0036]